MREHGIDHFFHLAAVYDMTASAAVNELANVEGTHHALELAEALGARLLHHVSSVAVAGGYRGDFTEDMFEVGQPLGHPYHRTKFESERLVRETAEDAVADLPAVDRGRRLTQRPDRQGRRALLLLPAAEARARS